MIAPFLLAGLIVQSQSASPDVQSRSSLQLPKAIVAPVSDYITCLQEAVVRIANQTKAVRSDEMRRVMMRAKDECSGARARDRSKAIELLNGDIVTVDTTFATVDAQLNQFPDDIEAAERRAGAEKLPVGRTK